MMWKDLPTPCYVADEKKLKENLRILQKLEKDTGCHVLLAQKAFSMFSLYPIVHALRKKHIPILTVVEKDGQKLLVRIPSGS